MISNLYLLIDGCEKQDISKTVGVGSSYVYAIVGTANLRIMCNSRVFCRNYFQESFLSQSPHR